MVGAISTSLTDVDMEGSGFAHMLASCSIAPQRLFMIHVYFSAVSVSGQYEIECGVRPPN